MKIRRYLGHDCDSFQGFNNGHYIDDEPIEVKDYVEAERLCIEALKERYEFKEDELEDHGSDMPCIELITSYSDGRGNELTKEEFESLEGKDADISGYRYVYVSANIAE